MLWDAVTCERDSARLECWLRAFTGRGDGSEDRPGGRADSGVATTGCAAFLVFAQALLSALPAVSGPCDGQ